ncbi:hypothetical protein [Pararhodobacter sp.]|uniref:hypothetical protein n=1 Tax=Pararhodobacter sp. TaxID=2127056 RepID=UPI002AFE5F83|nr:hypothetical protein [Pararhodobacter sp.]
MMGTFRAKAPEGSTSFQKRRRAVRAGLVASVAALTLAAGCSQTSSDRTSTGLYRFLGSERNPGIETLENTVQYAVVPASRSMVSAPQALVVFERNLGGAIEQRIVLPNDTTVSGDNVLHVRAQTSDSSRLDQFDFDDLSARFGGMPSPFERLSASGLNSGTDSLGSFVYGTENIGTGTVCVLVMRRLGVGARPLPRGTRALDVVMRNCVNGTVQDALAPMSERALGVSGTAQSGIHSLSPYAAPQP